MRRFFALGGFGVLGVAYAAPLGCDAGGMEITPIHSAQTNSIVVEGLTAMPASGQLFIVTELELANTSSRSFDLNPVLFSITTTAGVEFKGDVRGVFVEGGCKPDSALAPGGSTTCTLVFEAPSDAVTKTIAYHDPEDVSTVIAEVALETATCTVCGGACVDLTSDPKNCGTCGKNIGVGTCVNGAPVCPADTAACDGVKCVSLLDDEENCGACATPVPAGHSCEDGKPSETAVSSCKTAANGNCHNADGSGCFECVTTGTAADGTNGGVCTKEFVTAFAMDGMCTSGGSPKSCFLRDCWRGCDANGDGDLIGASESQCFCGADSIGGDLNACLGNTSPSTCIGKGKMMFGDSGGLTPELVEVLGCVRQHCASDAENCL